MTALEPVDDHRCVIVAGPGAPQRPTAPDCVDGIVSVEPFEQQCRVCGRIAGPVVIGAPARRGDLGISVIVSGFRFHTCEGPGGVRRCPECHAAVIAACTLRRHDE